MLKPVLNRIATLCPNFWVENVEERLTDRLIQPIDLLGTFVVCGHWPKTKELLEFLFLLFLFTIWFISSLKEI